MKTKILILDLFMTFTATKEMILFSIGVLPIDRSDIFCQMPAEVIKKSPISLWNTSREIHTGRTWEFLLGPFYILIVPLTGLASVLILVTGFFAWWIPYRRKIKKF